MDTTKEISCPSCQAILPADAYFCSQCGVKLKNLFISTSISKQAIIYFISFFLAPFGLAYVFRYLKQSDSKARKIGIAALILTILGISLTILTAKVFMDSLYSFDTLNF
ncbi:zinc ribbon domain-containing protein [Candidatus Wolfebacteria bacterium]|nr:zinc ribbon domain-containing protein [Candidatus Wolfebacteria bacterium]